MPPKKLVFTCAGLVKSTRAYLPKSSAIPGAYLQPRCLRDRPCAGLCKSHIRGPLGAQCPEGDFLGGLLEHRNPFLLGRPARGLPEALEASVPGALSGVHGPVWAYIDPPYQNTTPYAGVPPEKALSRTGVMRIVEHWRSAGASVAVSEGCAIPGATRAFEVRPAGLGQTARGSTKQEWVSVFEQAP